MFLKNLFKKKDGVITSITINGYIKGDYSNGDIMVSNILIRTPKNKNTKVYFSEMEFCICKTNTEAKSVNIMLNRPQINKSVVDDLTYRRIKRNKHLHIDAITLRINPKCEQYLTITVPDILITFNNNEMIKSSQFFITTILDK